MTLYEILEVHQTSTQTEIKQSYRRLAKQYHPDMSTGNEQKFKDINNAYTTLSDEKKRAEYDMSLNFSQFRQFDDLFKPRENLNIERSVKIRLQDAYYGNTIRVEIYSNDIVEVKIPQGIRNGQKIKCEGLGTVSKQDPKVKGDLIITVRMDAEEDNIRCIDLLDLETTIKINTFKLMFDFEIDVKIWDTNIGKIKLNRDLDVTKRIRIKGKGLKHTTFNTVGDLYIRLIPETPKYDELPTYLQESINNYIKEIGDNNGVS